MDTASGSPARSDDSALVVVNPATFEVVGEAPNHTVAEALSLLERVDGEKSWARETTMLERREIVSRLIALLDRDADELARLMTFETGKPIRESNYEVHYAREIFRVFADEAPHAMTGIASPLDAQFSKTSDYYMSRREPLGTMLAIISFNNPVELFAYKVAPALLAGNKVIVKPSELAPLSIRHMTDLLYEAGLPPDVLQCVTSDGTDVPSALVADERIQCVSFTGSTAVGRKVAASAGSHLAKVILELGGNDPFIVLPDADLEQAARMAAAGRAENAGQSCCANKRMIVHPDVVEEFTERLVDELTSVWTVGEPLDESTMLGPLITAAAADLVASQVQHTIDQGAALLSGGERVGTSYYSPAVLTQVDRSTDIAKDMEIFGPVFPIIVAGSDEEVLETANQTSYGLNAGIFTKSIDRAFWFSTRLECGLAVINGSPLYRPFIHGHGGAKQTGLGREGLRQSFAELTQEKGIAFRNVL